VAIDRIPALVLFEEGKPENERTALAIAERLAADRFDVKVRAASAVSIPEILAAKLYFLGAESRDCPSYHEVARLFKGINLAGRKAAFFGSDGAAVAWLRGLCSDTDVSSAHADLVGHRPDPAALASWIRGIA
jgi:hypothetical protein